MKQFAVTISSLIFSLTMVGQTIKSTEYKLPGFVQINDTLFIANYETSVRDYAKFLLYVSQKEKDSAKLQSMLPSPNSTDWTMWSSFYKKLTTFNNDLFEIKDTSISFTSWLGNYPIVNIERYQTIEYCNFKTKDYQAFYNKLKQKQKFKYPKDITFRLPTAKEWTKIARTPLENPNVVCKEFFRLDTTGQFMPVQVDKGCFNAYEIYNMTGNVAELVNDTENVYGGSFKEIIDDCNSTSFRQFKKGDNSIGFRIVAIIKNK